MLMCSPMAMAGACHGYRTSGTLDFGNAFKMYREMNYNIVSLEQERTDAFDHAVADISNVRLNSLQLNSGVKAAVNETMSGRTANLIVRSAEGDTARAVASIQDNYDRKSNEVDLNRERAVLSTEAYLKNLNASAPRMPSRLSNFVSFAGSALNAFASAKAQTNNSISNSSSGKNAANTQWQTYSKGKVVNATPKFESSIGKTDFTNAKSYGVTKGYNKVTW